MKNVLGLNQKLLRIPKSVRNVSSVKTNNNWQNHWNVVPLSAGQSQKENYLYDYETLIRSDYLREAKPKA